MDNIDSLVIKLVVVSDCNEEFKVEARWDIHIIVSIVKVDQLEGQVMVFVLVAIMITNFIVDFTSYSSLLYKFKCGVLF